MSASLQRCWPQVVESLKVDQPEAEVQGVKAATREITPRIGQVTRPAVAVVPIGLVLHRDRRTTLGPTQQLSGTLGLTNRCQDLRGVEADLPVDIDASEIVIIEDTHGRRDAFNS